MEISPHGQEQAVGFVELERRSSFNPEKVKIYIRSESILRLFRVNVDDAAQSVAILGRKSSQRNINLIDYTQGNTGYQAKIMKGVIENSAVKEHKILIF